MAQIKLHPGVEYSYAQSKYPQAPQLPARCLIYAPSGSGKTIALVSLFTDIMRQANGQSCWARIYMVPDDFFGFAMGPRAQVSEERYEGACGKG